MAPFTNLYKKRPPKELPIAGEPSIGLLSQFANADAVKALLSKEQNGPLEKALAGVQG